MNVFFIYCFWGVGFWVGDLIIFGGRVKGVIWGDLDFGLVIKGLGFEFGVFYNVKKNYNDVYLYGDVWFDFNDIFVLRVDYYLIINFYMIIIEWFMIIMVCGYL